MPKTKMDPETLAIVRIMKMLADLDADARDRVLTYVVLRAKNGSNQAGLSQVLADA